MQSKSYIGIIDLHIRQIDNLFRNINQLLRYNYDVLSSQLLSFYYSLLSLDLRSDLGRLFFDPLAFHSAWSSALISHYWSLNSLINPAFMCTLPNPVDF